MNNIKRIKDRIDEYSRIFGRIPIDYDVIFETNDTIQLYVRPGLMDINFFLYAMIDLDIDKKLEVYKRVLHYCKGITVEYDLRYADYRDSIIMQLYFFRALYFANRLNRPELYRKILEMGGKRHFDHVKMLLNTGGSYINSVGCRTQLIDYINKHNNEEDISL